MKERRREVRRRNESVDRKNWAVWNIRNMSKIMKRKSGH